MRIPRIRFTVRLYMAVVAAFTLVIALGVQATRLVRLREADSMLKWHADMKRKWQRAADRPWESVSPDTHPFIEAENVSRTD